MVSSLRRSLSFSNPSPKTPKKTFHIRSTSLPSTSSLSHVPYISHINHQISLLKTWSTDHKSPTWLINGLTNLTHIHHSLDDLINLTHIHNSLLHSPNFIENVLEYFLKFADVYGIFKSLMLTVKEEQSVLQLNLRRRDNPTVKKNLIRLKKLGSEINQLAGKLKVPARFGDESEVVIKVIVDVIEVTVMVSTVIFKAISFSSGLRKSNWLRREKNKGNEGFWGFGVGDLRKEGDEEVKMVLNRMYEMEDCIGAIESGSERVFRSLINTRVSLLNVLAL